MIFHSSFLMERRAFVKPNYLVFMKNVRKYLGLVSMSLVCASPLAAMVIQPFVGVTIVQQNVITVKGQVMDEKGEAIIGANVIVEGTAQGMITDMNGNFSFQCPVGAILKVSYIGYLSQTIKVSGNAGTLKVILKEDAETLDEVVVVGYGMVKKSDLTGSVASVNVDEMAKRNPVNIGQALQGAAAGVQVMRNGGDPSGETTIRIRGIGTVQGSADPLYVIDGIISSASMVNPADIASIEVLKDASATAIYGSRAANGVVMITTKRGDKNKSRINFTANLSVQSVNNTIDVADADLFTWGVRQSKAADGKSLTNLAWGEQYAGQLQTIDWQKEMTRTALSRNYRLSASGGSSTSNYMASIGYTKNDGTIINSWYERITARANAASKIRDFLTVNTNLAYVRTGSHGGGNMRSYALTVPTMDHLDENGNLMNVPIKYPDGSYGVPLQEMNGDVPRGSDNLVARAYDNDSKNFTDQVQIDFGLTVDILKGLTFKTTNSYNVTNKSSWDYSPRNERTITSDGLDTFSMEMSRSSDWNSENYFNYIFDTKGHHINAMVGQSFNQSVDGFELKGSAKDFPADNYRDIASTLNSTTKNVEGALKVKTTSLSYFGRLIYSYKDKYLFTGTIRRDGSSAFGRTNRWGTFPSASVAWRLNEESFIKNLNIFSNLKFRIGWGKTGSSYGDGSKSIAQISTSKMYYYWWNGVNYTEQMGAAKDKEIDTNLHWETNEQTNLGIDMGFMDNALNVTLDYFIRNSYDLLLDRNMRPSTGFTSIYTNAGKIQNKGFEFAVNYRKTFGDWFVNVGVNGSALRNEVKEVGDPIFATEASKGYEWDNHSIIKNGYAIGSFYGYRVKGIFQNQAEIDALNNASSTGKYQSGSTQPGDYYYWDKDGNGYINADDKDIIGNGFPKLTYGISINANYRKWDFMLYGYGAYGQDILSYSAMSLSSIHNSTGEFQNCLQEYISNAWTPENHSTKYARMTVSDNNKNTRVSDAWIKKGDFFRLQNIQVGYTFDWGMRIYGSIENLFTISSYNKYGDPEIGTGRLNLVGYDSGRYPYQRTYSVGLSLQF